MANFILRFLFGAEFSELEKKVETLQAVNYGLANSCNFAKKQLAVMTSRLQETEGECERRTYLLQKKEKEYKSEIETYVEETERLKKDIIHLQKEKARLEDNKTENDKRLDDYANLLHEKDEECKRKAELLQKKEKEFQDVSVVINNRTEETNILKEEITHLKDEKSKLEYDNKEKEEQLNNFANTLKEKEDELGKIKMANAKSEEKHKQEIKDFNNYAQSDSPTAINVETCSNDNNKEIDGGEMNGNENEEIDSEYNTDKLEELQDKIDTVEQEKEGLKAKLDDYKKRYDELKEQYENQKSKLSLYEKKYETQETHTSEKSQKEPEVINLYDTHSGTTTLVNPVDVKNLKIDKVIDVNTGEEIIAREFFSKPVDEIFHIRRELQNAIILEKPKYVCKYCGQMVKISGRYDERGVASFFSHLYDSDKCDLKTTTGLSKAIINARKYGEFGESERHKCLKKQIADILMLENSISMGITDVQNEKTIFGSHPLFRWRRPDVYCKYKDIEIVFELQLSTTFSSVIAERELFYKMHHIYVIWVFNFSENEQHVDLRNMMMKDIYFENHRNVFIFDREAIFESCRRKELVLKCDWLEADGHWHYSKGDNYGTHGILVSLSELKYNAATYKPFYHAPECSFSSSTDAEDSMRENELKDVINLLDKKYEKIKKRQECEEERIKMILDAIDVDRIAKRYKSMEVAIVEKDKKFGLFDYKYNKELLPAQYLSIKLLPSCRHYLVIENMNGKFQLYDVNEKMMLRQKYVNVPKFENGCSIAPIKNNGNDMFCLIYNHDQTLHESEPFNYIEKISDDYFLITKRQKDVYLIGLMSASGYIEIKPEYTSFNYFSDNLFHVVKKGKHGIINEKGGIVLDFDYDGIDKIIDGKAKVYQGTNVGYIDNSGQPIYEEIVALASKPRRYSNPEKRLFMNKWHLFGCSGVSPWSGGNVFDEICHYQGHLIAFKGDAIKQFEDIPVKKECGIKGVLKERTKKGLFFSIGSRVAKMNRTQIKYKPKEITYEIGKEYCLYISCVNTDIDMVYVSPRPSYGPTKRRPRSYSKSRKKYSSYR